MRVFRAKSIIAVMIFAVLVGIFAAAPAFAAIYVKNSWIRFSGTAGETLALGDIVCIKDADGKVWKADANGAGLTPAVGIVSKAASTNTTVGVTIVGVFGGYSTLSEGQNVYLSETAGGYTQSSPAYSQAVGVALTTTTVYYNFRNYLDTSAITALGTLTGATPIVLEGATADDFETTISVTDPTADRTVTLPDASGTAMLSALATNAPDAANSVTGKSNALEFEGATANAFETIITPTDPTADRTWTLPDKSGTFESTIKVVTTDNNGKTVAAAEAGDLQVCSGAGVWTLPEASTVIGAVFPFAVSVAANCDINPDNADQILGLADAAGDAIRCAAAGGTITLMAIDATNWVAFGAYCPGGTWTDVN